MIMDALMFFDGSQSSSGVLSGTTVSSGSTFTSGATTDSANIIDVSQIASSASGLGRDIGATGEAHDLNIICQVLTTFTGSSSTLQIEVQTAPDNGSGSPGSTWTPLALSNAIPLTGLTGGTEIFRVTVPLGVQKFLKLTYIVGTANMTAGQIMSFIAVDRTFLGPSLGYKSGYSNQYL